MSILADGFLVPAGGAAAPDCVEQLTEVCGERRDGGSGDRPGGVGVGCEDGLKPGSLLKGIDVGVVSGHGRVPSLSRLLARSGSGRRGGSSMSPTK